MVLTNKEKQANFRTRNKARKDALLREIAKIADQQTNLSAKMQIMDIHRKVENLK